MNAFSIIAVLLMSLAASAHDHPSTHGMVAFGQETLYLSHMPMFHKPHDYQVIFKAEMSEDAKKIYAAVKAGDEKNLVTIVPEPFALDEMIENPHSFKADLYKGHFERGGVKIASGVEMMNVEVIHAHKLGDPHVPEPIGGVITFGSMDESFQAHFIKGEPPEFDEISTVELMVRNPKPTVFYREVQDLTQ